MKLEVGMKLILDSADYKEKIEITEFSNFCGREIDCGQYNTPYCKGRVELIRYYDDELQEEVSGCYSAIEKNFIPLTNTIRKLT